MLSPKLLSQISIDCELIIVARHLPSFQFYPADWLKDPRLKRCTRETKGMWIDIICYLHESDTRGKISATVEEWCRLAGCSAEEFSEFLTENKQKKFADISERNGFVTVKNRRMYREEKARQDNNNRQKRHRSKKNNGDNNEDLTEDVTPYSSSSPSTSVMKGVTESVTTLLKWFESKTAKPPLSSKDPKADRDRLEAVIVHFGEDRLLQEGETFLNSKLKSSGEYPFNIRYLLSCWEGMKEKPAVEELDPYAGWRERTQELNKDVVADE